MSDFDNTEKTLDLPVEEIQNELESESSPEAGPIFPDDSIVEKDKKEESSLTGSQKPKKPKKKGPSAVVNMILTLLTVLVNILIVYEIVNITSFASLSKKIFALLNVAAIVVLLLLDILVFLMIRLKKKWIMVCVIILSLLLGSGGVFAGYALYRVNNSVNNLTATQTEENVKASLVIYSATEGNPITDVKSLDGRKVGISTGSSTGKIAEARFKNEGVTPAIEQYSGYTDLFTGLINGEIDCAVLPVDYASDFSADEALAEYVPSTSSILDFSDSVISTNESGAQKDITKEPFTVLLTGENEGLADTIMLISVNPVSMKITMSSIARDSFVPISCYNNNSSKINSAHAVSESCMVQTVENLTGVDIDYTVEFNFASVIQVVDAVGGVDVDIPAGFWAQCWDVATDKLVVYRLEAGENVHLDGARALGFARERHAFADGDFARQRHQQEIIEQVIGKIMASKDPNMLLNVMDAAGDNIKTNFTKEQMVSFVSYAMQKAKRYYNQNSLAGVFNIQTSRIYGYGSSMWNPGLGLDLYIYRLYDGSIRDTREAIERNLNLDSPISAPDSVSWSASEEYTPPVISQEVYSEQLITDSGRPESAPVEQEEVKPQPEQNVTPEPETPQVAPEPQPQPEPSPEPAPNPEPQPQPQPEPEPEPQPAPPVPEPVPPVPSPEQGVE